MLTHLLNEPDLDALRDEMPHPLMPPITHPPAPVRVDCGSGRDYGICPKCRRPHGYHIPIRPSIQPQPHPCKPTPPPTS